VEFGVGGCGTCHVGRHMKGLLRKRGLQYCPVGRSIRAQSQNLPSVFDIARRLGLHCIIRDMVSIYIGLGVQYVYRMYDIRCE
jgi:hypothetical protein